MVLVGLLISVLAGALVRQPLDVSALGGVDSDDDVEAALVVGTRSESDFVMSLVITGWEGAMCIWIGSALSPSSSEGPNHASGRAKPVGDPPWEDSEEPHSHSCRLGGELCLLVIGVLE